MRRSAFIVILTAATLGLAGVVAAPAEAVGHGGRGSHGGSHGGGGHKFHGGGPGFHGGGAFHGHRFHEFHHHRFFGGPVFVGPEFRFGVWGQPYPAYTYTPPVVIQPEPQVYVQPQAPTYWYYCADAKAYYPYVQQCPGEWLTVVPTPR